jgi:hypothetical protein
VIVNEARIACGFSEHAKELSGGKRWSICAKLRGERTMISPGQRIGE